LKFFLVFAATVRAVKNPDSGELLKLPQTKPWANTCWFAGRSKLTVSGGTRIWGPWEQSHQVWEAHLNPNETRRLVLRPDRVSAAEAAQIAAAAAPRPALTRAAPPNHRGRSR
jgi:hypothetical protein